MAEIRSTLDIIMERTKNLTLSDEEKAEIQKQNLSGKTKGWVQKYLDSIISIKEIKSEIDSEKSKVPSDVEKILKNELIGRLDPEGDNEKIYRLLQEIFNIDIDLLEQVIGKFHEDVIKEKAKKIEALRQALAQIHISGSAVVPNVDNDASWLNFYEESVMACKKQLSIIADRETIDAQ
jgi:hypothetical protein